MLINFQRGQPLLDGFDGVTVKLGGLDLGSVQALCDHKLVIKLGEAGVSATEVLSFDATLLGADLSSALPVPLLSTLDAALFEECS